MNRDENPGGLVRVPEIAIGTTVETTKRAQAAMRRAQKRAQEDAEERAQGERRERQQAQRREGARLVLDAARAQDDARTAQAERLRFYDKARRAVERELLNRFEAGSLGALSMPELVKVLAVIHGQQRRDTVTDVSGFLPTIVFRALAPYDDDGLPRLGPPDTLAEAYALADGDDAGAQGKDGERDR